MRHRFEIGFAAAVLAAVMGTAPALAQDNWGKAAAGVRLESLTFDLTALPGQQSPAVNFNMAYDPSINNFTVIEAQAVTIPGQSGPALSSTMGPFDDQWFASHSDLASGHAYVLSFGMAERASFEAWGMASSGDGLSWFSAGVNGPYTGYGAWFTLSPYTELVIRGWASLGVEGSGGNEAGISDSNAYAHAWMSFTGPPAYGGGGSQSDTAFLSLAGSSYYGGSPFDLEDQQWMQIRFVNGTDAPMDARFEFSVYVAGMANPVPEPASWALMLGGLALVGAALRRR